MTDGEKHEGGKGGFVEGNLSRSDTLLIRRAVADRWNVSDHMRQLVVKKVSAALKKASTPREIRGLGYLILALDEANLAHAEPPQPARADPAPEPGTNLLDDLCERMAVPALPVGMSNGNGGE